MRALAIIGVLLLTVSTFGAAYTSSQSGPWSAAATWGGSGPPGSGDTASIGAHTVNVDVDTTVGTSPNDNTTKVINMTSASSILVITNGVTLTCKGNIGHVNGSTHRQRAGSTLTFDNSGSGGSPVYTFINAGFSNFDLQGSSGSLALIQAISGQTCGVNAPWGTVTMSFAKLLRCSALNPSSLGGNVAISDSTVDTCAKLALTSSSGTISITFDRNTFTNSTDSTTDLSFSKSTFTSGTLRIANDVHSKSISYLAKGFTIVSNCFFGGFDGVATSTVLSFRNNFIAQDGTHNGGNGQLFPFSFERNYFVVTNNTGNPHFVSATALTSVNNTFSQNIFESQATNASDFGDCVLINNAATSGGFIVIGQNNIVLPSGRSGSTEGSGTLVTIFNNTTTPLCQFTRNTGNIATNAAAGKRGMFAVSESSAGAVGQLAVLKSNLAWASASGQGYLGESVNTLAGAPTNVITASGADYNWVYNTSTGNNLLSYNNKTTTNAMWTAGFAVASGVDSHQGSGDPQFYDSARNVAKWCYDRGYGAQTYAAGVAAIMASPGRTVDLINYVFEGYRPQNASCRNAAADGGCVGAANYAKSRDLSTLTRYRTTLSIFGL